jgi:hypothetical protein
VRVKSNCVKLCLLQAPGEDLTETLLSCIYHSEQEMTGEDFLFSLNVETWISKFKKLNFLSVEPAQLRLDGILGYFLANVSLLKWI